VVEEVPEVEEVQKIMVLEARNVQEIRNGSGDLRLLRLGGCGRFALLDARDVQDLKILEGMYVIFKDWGCLVWSRSQVRFDVQDFRELRLSAVATVLNRQARHPALNSGYTCVANELRLGSSFWQPGLSRTSCNAHNEQIGLYGLTCETAAGAETVAACK
jgi:hypothetical protein